jgi:hypothetical protein
MSIAYNSKPGLSWPITGAALQEPTGSLAARRRHVHVHVVCACACACNPNPNPNPYPNPNQVKKIRAGETGMVWVSEKSCAGYAIRGLGTRHGPHRGRWWYTGNRSKASADARTRWRGPGSVRPCSFQPPGGGFHPASPPSAQFLPASNLRLLHRARTRSPWAPRRFACNLSSSLSCVTRHPSHQPAPRDSC